MDSCTWVTPEQVVATYPGLTKGRLAQLRFNRMGPPFYKPTPRTVLYKEQEVAEWVEASMQSVA